MQTSEGFRKILGARLNNKPPHPPFTPEEFLSSITLIPDLNQLLESFTSKFREMFDASSIYLILFEPVTGRYQGRKSKGDKPELLAEFNLLAANRLIKWLSVNECPLVVESQPEVMKYLTDGERGLLAKGAIQVVVPMVVMNRLSGIVFVGGKSGGSSYTANEMNMMSVLAGQSGLAIQYAVIYQFQEDRLKRLFHADKLATVGELAAGAAHEIRNPLAAVRSTVQYILQDLPPEKKELADGLIEEVDRIDRIVNGLLSFSRNYDLHMEDVDIHSILDQTVALLEPELKKNAVDVVRKYNLANPIITGDDSQLKQVFLNILLNSIQAMEKGGTISISTRTGSGVKGSISIEIADNGTGISEKDVSRVFDPFYTTKENGSGLGLSISYGIVSKHGGNIEIRSNAERGTKGTTVVVELPVGAGPEV